MNPPLESVMIIGISRVMRERYANGSIIHDRFVRSYIYPLDDETIERLAKAMYEAQSPVWSKTWPWETWGEESKEYRRVGVRAVLAELTGEGGSRE